MGSAIVNQVTTPGFRDVRTGGSCSVMRNANNYAVLQMRTCPYCMASQKLG